MAEAKGEGQDYDGLRGSQGLGEALRNSPLQRAETVNIKFMQTLDKRVYNELNAQARERRITVQVLLRAVVVPDWLRANRPDNRRT